MTTATLTLVTNVTPEFGALPDDSPYKTHRYIDATMPGSMGLIGRHRPMTRAEFDAIVESLAGKVDIHSGGMNDWGFDAGIPNLQTTSRQGMIDALIPWADRIEVDIERFDDEFSFTLYRLA